MSTGVRTLDTAKQRSLHFASYTRGNNNSRGNDFRLLKNGSHYDLRKFSFTNRIVNIWNSLPNAVVDVNSVQV